MKRLIAYTIILLTLGCANRVNCTSLTGTINLPNATAFNGWLVLALSQQAALATTGGCGGPIMTVPTYQVRIQVTSGSLVGSPSVYGNDCLLPQNTFYYVFILDTNGNTLSTDQWYISGSSINIGTIISALTNNTLPIGAVGVVYTTPVGSQVISQSVGTVFGVNIETVSGTLTFPNGGVCNVTGCSGVFVAPGDMMTTDTNQTVTGNKTFNGANLLGSGSANIGTIGSPFSSAAVQGNVIATGLQIRNGTLASPIDEWTFALNNTHEFNLYDSSANYVMTISETVSGYPNNNVSYIYGSWAPGGGTMGNPSDNVFTLGFNVNVFGNSYATDRWKSIYLGTHGVSTTLNSGGTYNAFVNANWVGQATIGGGGSVVITSPTTTKVYSFCFASDTSTTPQPVSCTVSGSVMPFVYTLYGTAGHVVNYRIIFQD